jgi:hypothetical protein
MAVHGQFSGLPFGLYNTPLTVFVHMIIPRRPNATLVKGTSRVQHCRHHNDLTGFEYDYCTFYIQQVCSVWTQYIYKCLTLPNFEYNCIILVSHYIIVPTQKYAFVNMVLHNRNWNHRFCMFGIMLTSIHLSVPVPCVFTKLFKVNVNRIRYIHIHIHNEIRSYFE